MQSNNHPTLLKFLSLLNYSTEDEIFIRAINKSGAIKKKIVVARIDSSVSELEALNVTEKRGIYFVVNGQGQTDAEVKMGRAIFFEHDNLPKQEQIKIWEKLGLPEPTFQTDTGNKSIHSYWSFLPDEDVGIKEWSDLQRDIIEFAKADSANKNPSRMMRMPGFVHQETGKKCEVISESGKKYSFTELREAIPVSSKKIEPEPRKFTKAQAQVVDSLLSDSDLPIPPLSIFITKENQELLASGIAEGGRNASGAKLARDLIGASSTLSQLGILFNESARELFSHYCSICTPPIPNREEETIWDSASRSNPNSSLSEEGILNCLKGWAIRNSRNPGRARGEHSDKKNSGEKEKAIAFNFGKKWSKLELAKKIGELVSKNLHFDDVHIELAEISNSSGWDYRQVKQIFEGEISRRDREADLEEDTQEFENMVERFHLDCETLLPTVLHPLLKFADNLGVNREAVLVAFETTLASFIDPESKIIGRRSSNYHQNATLFTAIIGEPSSKKSPVINAIARSPLTKMQDKEFEIYENEMSRYEIDLEIWKNADPSLRGDKPVEPELRVFSTEDYTAEGLRGLMQYNPKILRCFDELAQEQENQGQYKGGKGGDSQRLLQSYDGIAGAVVRFNKVYPGGTVNQCLLGGIQPKVLSSIVSSADPTGLFARYNLAIIDSEPYLWGDDNDISLDISPLLIDVYETVDKIPALNLSLTKDAYDEFKNFHNKCELKKKEIDSPAMIYQLGKLPGKVLRLAMIYHVIHSIAGNCEINSQVNSDMIRFGIHRAKYQLFCASNVLSQMDDTPSGEMFRVWEHAWKKQTAVTPRDVFTKGKKTKTRKAAIDAFYLLEKTGWGKVEETSRTIKFTAIDKNGKRAKKEVIKKTEVDKKTRNLSTPKSEEKAESLAANTKEETTASNKGDWKERLQNINNYQDYIKFASDFPEIKSVNTANMSDEKKAKLHLYYHQSRLKTELKKGIVCSLGSSDEFFWRITLVNPNKGNVWLEDIRPRGKKEETPDNKIVKISEIKLIYFPPETVNDTEKKDERSSKLIFDFGKDDLVLYQGNLCLIIEVLGGSEGEFLIADSTNNQFKVSGKELSLVKEENEEIEDDEN